MGHPRPVGLGKKHFARPLGAQTQLKTEGKKKNPKRRHKVPIKARDQRVNRNGRQSALVRGQTARILLIAWLRENHPGKEKSFNAQGKKHTLQRKGASRNQAKAETLSGVKDLLEKGPLYLGAENFSRRRVGSSGKMKPPVL